MIHAVRALAIVLAFASLALAAPQSHAPAPHRKPSAPIPSLPSIARIRLDVSREHVVVTHEIDLPRGDWHGGDLDLYVAFGAPGAPRAVDARLIPVKDGNLEPAAEDAGEPVPVENASHVEPGVELLLGSPQMSGCILHIAEAAFRRAVAPGGMAALRVRALHPMPAEDARTGREVLVRLGAVRGAPLTIGRLQIASIDSSMPVVRAEARLCGAASDPYPLAIALDPPRPIATTFPAPLAPVLAQRRAADDLCVRFWLAR